MTEPPLDKDERDMLDFLGGHIDAEGMFLYSCWLRRYREMFPHDLRTGADLLRAYNHHGWGLFSKACPA